MGDFLTYTKEGEVMKKRGLETIIIIRLKRLSKVSINPGVCEHGPDIINVVNVYLQEYEQ